MPLLTDRGEVIGALTVRSREARRFGNDELRFLEPLSNLLATSLQRAQSEEAMICLPRPAMNPMHRARRTAASLRCEVTLAPSGEQALLNLGANATFDLLLTDIALGAGMRGTQLATLAQKRFPKLAVLLMSGFSTELLNADRDSPPTWELLRKPYSRDELARAIARVVASR